MGLFDLGSALVYVGTPEERRPAGELLEGCGKKLEREFNDTPTEYLILQAAGMYVALLTEAVDITLPDETLQGCLREAKEILASRGVKREVTPEIESSALELAGHLLDAVRDSRIDLRLLVGALEHLLRYLEDDHLSQTAREHPASGLHSGATSKRTSAHARSRGDIECHAVSPRMPAGELIGIIERQKWEALARFIRDRWVEFPFFLGPVLGSSLPLELDERQLLTMGVEIGDLRAAQGLDFRVRSALDGLAESVFRSQLQFRENSGGVKTASARLRFQVASTPGGAIGKPRRWWQFGRRKA